MISQKSQPIDIDLTQAVIQRIPTWTWTNVCDRIVEMLVDNMPSDVLLKLTGSSDDFDKAEAILKAFYQNGGNQEELINDAFHIFGTEEVLYALDALQLDKIAEPTND